jgi:hypothetical protein
MRLVLAALALLALAIALVVLTRPHPPTPMPTPPSPSREAVAPAPPPMLPAIDSGAAAARAEREHMVAKIVDRLGSHEESWNATGIDLLHAFGRGAQATTDLGCYMAGCIATFTFASESAYRAAYDEVTATPDYAAWTGGKRASAPEVLPDGRVIVAIALERPD